MTELLDVLKKHFVFILIIVFCSIALSVGFLLIDKPSYTAITRLLVNPMYNLELTMESKTLSTNISSEIQHLDNHSTFVKALQNMDLTQYLYENGSDYSDLLTNGKKLENLIKYIRISEITGTKVIEISIKHSNYEFAEAFLRILCDTFNTRLSELANEQIEKEHLLLKTKLEEAEANLAKLEASQDEFQSTPISIESSSNRGNYQRILSFIDVRIRDVEPFSKGATIPDLLEAFKLQDSTTTNLIEAYSKAYRKLLFYEVSQLIYPTRANEIESKDYFMTFYRDTLQSQKTVLSNHLKLLKDATEVEGLLFQMTSTTEYSILVDEQQFYLNKVKEYKATDLLVEKINSDLILLKNKVIQITNELESFEGYRLIRIKPTYTVDPIRIIDEEGDTNKKIILAKGLLLGLLLGMLVAFLDEYLSGTINNESFMRRVVEDKVQIWCTIPFVRKKRNHNSVKIISSDSKNRTSEAFDQLAGIIQYGNISIDKPIYCFSSLGYGETSIDTVLNLALELMGNGKKVLVIGTNVGEANYSDIFSTLTNSSLNLERVTPIKMDLHNGLKANSDSSLLHLASADIGLQEHFAYLHSDEFGDFLESATKEYDVILIDGPIFRSPSDLLAVANVSGGLILNVRQGFASKRAFRALFEITTCSPVSIVGIVFNAMYGMPSFREKRKKKKQNLS